MYCPGDYHGTRLKYIHKPQSERETRMLRDAEVTKRFIFTIASDIVGVGFQERPLSIYPSECERMTRMLKDAEGC